MLFHQQFNWLSADSWIFFLCDILNLLSLFIIRILKGRLDSDLPHAAALFLDMH